MPTKDKASIAIGHLETMAVQGETKPGNAPSDEPLASIGLRNRERYKFIGEHARGGLGRIWRVRDRELGRDLALKELLAPTPDALARFAQEALLTARLEHPAIVPVHDAGHTEAGELFYTMKFVSGQSLTDAVHGAPTLAARLALLPRLLSVAEAIAYAHQRHIVHRDLKPANVLVGDFGETAVVDWGLAKDMHAPNVPDIDTSTTEPSSQGLTHVGAIMGTPGFMPPEQARGEAVDFFADIYALGACLYFIVSGKAPHQGSDAMSVLQAVRDTEPMPVEALEPKMPADLASIVRRALARQPSARYESAKAFADDLSRFLSGQPVKAHQYSVLDSSARWAQKHRALTAAVLGGLLALLVGALFASTRESRLRQVAETERESAVASRLTLLEQQGRAELASGHPSRAGVYLAEALRQSPQDEVIHSLLSQAVQAVASKRLEFVGHTKDVVSVAFSPKGDLVASGSDDTSVRLWNAQTGTLVRVLGHHRKSIDAVAFSSDGTKVLSAGLDGAVQVFSVADATSIKSLKASDCYRAVFTPEGAQIVIGGQSGLVQVLNAETGAVEKTLHQHRDRTQQLAFAPDGSLVIPSWDGTVSVWSRPSFTLNQVLRFDFPVSSVAFSSDGKWAAVAESEASIHLYALPSWSRSHSFQIPAEARWPRISFHQGDAVLLSRSFEGVTRAWHASSGALLAAVDVLPEGKLFFSDINAHGDQLLVGGLGGSMSVWSLARLLQFTVLPLGVSRRTTVLKGEWSRDGQVLATATDDGFLSLWNTRGQELSQQAVGARPSTLALSTAGNSVLTTHGIRGDNETQVWSLDSLQLKGRISADAIVYNAASSRDGRFFAQAQFDGKVRIVDALKATPLQLIPIDINRLSAVTFSPDGQSLVVANAFGKLFFVDIVTGRQTRTLQAHATWTEDVEFSEDGRRLVTAGRQDHQVRVWDVATGQQVLNLSQHQDNVMRASLSRDGALLATAATDNTAHLFEAHSGRVLRSWHGPSYTAAFSPDGSHLLTTGINGYAVVWPLSKDKRSAEELIGLAQTSSPWTWNGGQLALKHRAQ